MKKINLKINGREISCATGLTIMQAAREHDLELPNLCFHPDLSVKANCRICVVEIADRPNLATACSTQVEAGMEIITDSERVKRSRNLNIELIFSEHIKRCPTCVWRFNCKILELADRYKIEITKFSARKSKRKVYKFANAVELDGRQCIDCRNCLNVCNKLQKINFLELKGKGISQEISPVNKTSSLSFIYKKANQADCIYCGQCAVHCPVGAAQEQAHWRPVEKALQDKSKIVIAQFSPLIKISLSEEFNREDGKIRPEQTAGILKQLGFNYVFDVNFGAEITALAEAEELLSRLESGNRPMFTSFCPAWVKYVEAYCPDLLPNLSSARSQQIYSGGLIKAYWAEKIKINPKDIIMVSIMPCTAKKFEASRAELKINGCQPVDYALTVRELAWLIKKKRIDFSEIKPVAADNIFEDSAGAAAMYGLSGAGLEATLRAAEYLLMAGQNSVSAGAGNKLKFVSSRIDFKNFYGSAGFKEAEIELGGKKLKAATVNGIGNIKLLLKNFKNYDYAEVMACPDGCSGGGGQPIPTTAAIRKKRIEAWRKVYLKNRIRPANENPAAVKALNWLREKGEVKTEVKK